MARVPGPPSQGPGCLVPYVGLVIEIWQWLRRSERQPAAHGEWSWYQPPPAYRPAAAPPMQAQQPVYQHPVRRDPDVTAALVASLGSLFCCPLLGIAGVILGVRSYKRIKCSGGWLSGSGLAVAAIVISISSITVWTIAVILLFMVGASGTMQ
jgi:hypothetical protein